MIHPTNGHIPRVCMLSVHTCPLATLGGKETGGMNVYVRELARELGTRGIYVDVFTRQQNPGIPKISRRLGETVRVIHLPAGSAEPYDKNRLVLHLPEFAGHIKAFTETQGIRYDIVHGHYWHAGLVADDLRQGWGTPYVEMFHTLARLKNRVAQRPSELEPALRAEQEERIIRDADRVIAATTLEREQMAELYGADPKKISIVPPGVDLTLFRPLPCEEARASIGLPPDTHMILFVGRIQAIKGIDLLIRAMAELLERNPSLEGHVTLVIIGGHGDPSTDEELQRLLSLRADLDVSHTVAFLGSRDQDTLVDYYNAASVVVVPSHYESFGMVALEAMACGTPVIATDVGGLSLNVADGYNGYLVGPGDVDELAYKIGLLLQQDELRGQLGRQARQWAEGFGWHHIADETLGVYAQVLGIAPEALPPRTEPPEVDTSALEEDDCL